MQKNMGADVKTLGLISIVYYGAGIIASRLFGSRLSKRFSDRAVLWRRLFAAGYVLRAAAFVPNALDGDARADAWRF